MCYCAGPPLGDAARCGTARAESGEAKLAFPVGLRLCACEVNVACKFRAASERNLKVLRQLVPYISRLKLSKLQLSIQHI